MSDVFDRIVAQNEALWELLTTGDELPREEAVALVDRAFPSRSSTFFRDSHLRDAARRADYVRRRR